MSVDREGASLHSCALRIMEAMSGVDEALLERSDRNAGSGGRNTGNRGGKGEYGGGKGEIRDGKSGNGDDKSGGGLGRRPLWQYGRAWAAVLCLAVLGVISWQGYLIKNGFDSAAPNSANSSGNAGGAGSDGRGGSGDNPTGMTVPGEVPEDGNANQGNASGNGSENIMDNSSGSGRDKNEQKTDSIDGMEGEGTEDIGSLIVDQTTESSSLGNIVILTEEEARNREGLGNYIPQKLPDGYVFEDAFWNEDTQTLSVGWSRGMDSILLSLKTAQDCQTVDTALAETYDVHLYEIPYGETVPKEYRKIFNHPVFAWEDFTPDIVKSRMASYNDRGDTDTPRGNFGVLLPEGVLIEFHGHGTAEQIWEIFQSMGL